MFNLGFIPLRAVPYVIAGVSAVIGVVGTLAVEHKLLPWLAKDGEENKPNA